MNRRFSIAGSVLLLLMLAMPCAWWIAFNVQQQAARHAMEERLEKATLTTITLRSNELRWYKPGKEILVNGHLFDVKSILPIAEGKLRITGLYDYQEQHLHAKLDELLQSKSGETPLEAKLVKWLSVVFVLEKETYNTEVCEMPVDSFAPSPRIYYQAFTPCILTPPPQV